MNQVIITGTIRFKNDLHEDGIALSISPLNDQNDQGGCLRVVAFGKLVKTINEHFPIGSRIGVCGHIQIKKKEIDGKKQYYQDIFVDTIEFLERKPNEPIQKEDKEISNDEEL